MIWIASLDKNCYFFNSGWLKYTGRTLEEEVGKGWVENVHPDDLKKCLDIYESHFDAQKEFKMEYRLKRHDGVYRWMLDNGVPRFTGNGEFAGFIGSCVDIDEIKELERRKDHFISAASHELKTPLTTMKVYAQVLEESLKNNETEQALEYVIQINKQIHKFSNLINDLLDLSNIQSKIFDYNKALIPYEAMLRDVVAHFQSIASAKAIVIKGSTNKKILGDKDRLSQVLINLLTNALKYSNDSSDIIINISESRNSIKTSVTDKGVGIPKQYRGKVFEKFFRVEDKTNQTFPGLGIGLYFSCQIIKNHGGDIWVEDTDEQTTTLTFTIPYQN
jgi:PAS domain S-box-containing protein